MRRLIVPVAVLALAASGCSDGSRDDVDALPGPAAAAPSPAPEATTATAAAPAATDPPVTEPPVTGPPVSEPPATGPPVTEPPATRPADTVAPDTAPIADGPVVVDLAGGVDAIEPDREVVIGSSVEGRPITVVRRGTAGGTKVLVVGAIHGDEDAGTAIVDVLRLLDVPSGVELWLARSMNPDGQAHRQRHNANGVDLNRNFAHNWGPIAEPGNWEYAGAGPASEPETQAMTALGEAVRPDLVLWYHQDLFRISPGRGRDGEIRARYAELTGLPLVAVTGGTYTGTASQWSRTIVDAGGLGFTVELGATLSDTEAIRHAEAVLTVAGEV